MTALDYGTVYSFLIGLFAGLIPAIRNWWTGKTPEKKKEALKDMITAFSDGKITAREIQEYIDSHF